MTTTEDFVSPLSAWIDRKLPISSRFYTPTYEDIPTVDWSVWLSIQESSPLHLATRMRWLGLIESRMQTESYLRAASETIDGLQGGWLDREEREMILNNHGEPPLPSLPLYLITCDDGFKEKLVYVGKTKNTSRFDGGHAAALKLHHPKYKEFEKKIYRATVWFHSDHEYIALDWIQPEMLALQLLDSVESQLIYNFQPELNTGKKKKLLAKWNFQIHVQNFLKGKFLNDHFL